MEQEGTGRMAKHLSLPPQECEVGEEPAVSGEIKSQRIWGAGGEQGRGAVGAFPTTSPAMDIISPHPAFCTHCPHGSLLDILYPKYFDF